MDDVLEKVRKGTILLADRAYDSDDRRERPAQRGAWANIKPLANRKTKPAFPGYLVERCFNKLKHFRAVATRYDKRADNFLASIRLASLWIWLRA